MNPILRFVDPASGSHNPNLSPSLQAGLRQLSQMARGDTLFVVQTGDGQTPAACTIGVPGQYRTKAASLADIAWLVCGDPLNMTAAEDCLRQWWTVQEVPLKDWHDIPLPPAPDEVYRHNSARLHVQACVRDDEYVARLAITHPYREVECNNWVMLNKEQVKALCEVLDKRNSMRLSLGANEHLDLQFLANPLVLRLHRRSGVWGITLPSSVIHAFKNALNQAIPTR